MQGATASTTTITKESSGTNSKQLGAALLVGSAESKLYPLAVAALAVWVGGRARELYDAESYESTSGTSTTYPLPTTDPGAIPVPFSVPFDYVSDDGVNTKVDDEGKITIFRGVPSVNNNGIGNPAYPPAVLGTSVAIGGDAGPLDANMGKPSNYTFWTTNPWVAYSFATRKGTTGGIVLVDRIPWGEVMPNPSPNKFIQGELQRPSGTTGAIPIPVK